VRVAVCGFAISAAIARANALAALVVAKRRAHVALVRRRSRFVQASMLIMVGAARAIVRVVVVCGCVARAHGRLLVAARAAAMLLQTRRAASCFAPACPQ